MKRAVVATVVLTLLVEVGLSIVWPNAVPRLALLPRPADSTGRYEDANGCRGNEYARSYERRGLFWIPTESSPAICAPIGDASRSDRADVCLRLGLARPIRFKGEQRWRVCRSEIERLMSTDLGWTAGTGPPDLFREGAGHSRPSIADCSSWLAARRDGWHVGAGHYDLAMGTRLDVDCGVLAAIAGSDRSVASYVDDVTVADVDLVPANAVRWCCDDRVPDTTTLGEYARRAGWERAPWRTGAVRFFLEPDTPPHDWRAEVRLVEIARADFDGDGIEDILAEWTWQSSGTIASGGLELLTRTAVGGSLQVRAEALVGPA